MLLATARAGALLARHHRSQAPLMAPPRNDSAWSTQRAGRNQAPWRWCTVCNDSWAYEHNIRSGKYPFCKCGAPWPSTKANPTAADTAASDVEWLKVIVQEAKSVGNQDRVDKLMQAFPSLRGADSVSPTQRSAQTLQDLKKAENQRKQAAESVLALTEKLAAANKYLIECTKNVQASRKAHADAADAFHECQDPDIDMLGEYECIATDGSVDEDVRKEMVAAVSELEKANTKCSDIAKKAGLEPSPKRFKKAHAAPGQPAQQGPPQPEAGPPAAAAAAASASSSPASASQASQEEGQALIRFKAKEAELQRIIADAENRAKETAREEVGKQKG